MSSAKCKRPVHRTHWSQSGSRLTSTPCDEKPLSDTRGEALLLTKKKKKGTPDLRIGQCIKQLTILRYTSLFYTHFLRASYNSVSFFFFAMAAPFFSFSYHLIHERVDLNAPIKNISKNNYKIHFLSRRASNYPRHRQPRRLRRVNPFTLQLGSAKRCVRTWEICISGQR